MVTTLKAKWHFALLAALLYLTAPLFNAAYYSVEYGRHAYSSNADSLGIPIFSFTLSLLILAPVYVAAVWLATRFYQGGQSLLAFDMSRPIGSVFWSLLLGGLALFALYDAAYQANRILPLQVVSDLAWIYLLLCLRSSLTGSCRRQTEQYLSS